MNQNGTATQETQAPEMPKDVVMGAIKGIDAGNAPMVIEAVPGGFIVTNDWGTRSVCTSVAKLVATVRAKYGTPKKAKPAA